MRHPIVMCRAAVVLTAFAAAQDIAAEAALRPGLWESRVVKQVMDGRDISTQMSGAMSQMQATLSRMPPEKRAQLEAMMKERGALTTGSAGSTKLCISPEMAARNKPMVDPEGRCQPAKINQSGNHTAFEINCNVSGTVMKGKGESTSAGDVITSRIDMNLRKENGETHAMHSETEMKYLGPDCGDVKPATVAKTQTKTPTQAKPKP